MSVQASAEDAPRSVPRYREIADTLREELSQGRYPVGGLFPKEVDLCARFSVSRFTVRSALAELEREGFLERHKARGTIVVSTEPQMNYVQSLGSIE
ncbi:MAG: GntR family transcriptional regulator, partial [Pseudomonadota bacterium]